MNIVPLGRPMLEVSDLAITLLDGTEIVTGVGFTVQAGEIFGLVGESGSGKTTIATALLGAVRSGVKIAGGSVLIDGRNILALDPESLRKVRGPLIAHVAQDPATALNPAARIGDLLEEVLIFHEPDLDKAARRARIDAAAQDVGLPSDDGFLKRFPHQISGGQQQRVLLALAVILQPRLIVLDEPTTALDVTTQAHVLATLRRLCRQHHIAAVYVSHDLAVVRELVDRLVVLYAGRMVEVGASAAIFKAPQHPYTTGLLNAIPDISGRRELVPIAGHAPALRERPDGCSFAPRCASASGMCIQTRPELEPVGKALVACHHSGESVLATRRLHVVEEAVRPEKTLASFSGVSVHYGHSQILHDVDLVLNAGICTALVGESGSGKTTFARAAVGLVPGATGTFIYDGEVVSLGSTSRSHELRRKIQYIFQNPYRALNPRQSVGEILRTAVWHFFPIDRREADQRAIATLARVALPADVMTRRPRDLSGGERQRVAIARALICEPELLICDEITSALDVSVQASILVLLQALQREGLTILFVAHDLAVVRAIADRVAVLRSGHIVEADWVDRILDAPAMDYTRSLVADSPRLYAAIPAQGRESSAIRPVTNHY